MVSCIPELARSAMHKHFKNIVSKQEEGGEGMIKRIIALMVSTVVLCGSVAASDSSAAAVWETASSEGRVEDLIGSMTLEQKISQMLMPAIRYWTEGGVKQLSEAPALAEALRQHQYGGLIVDGANIEGTEQTVRFISELQANNALSVDAQDTEVIPYLISADVEGGAVNRLTPGTRCTGSMAIGATWDNAEENARITGRVLGEEMQALGIHADLAPCIDVITDLADPGMSTRVFSDDPEISARLGLAFGEGLAESNIITCYKHFPGAGDGSDYPTSICLTSDQLEEEGLRACREIIENGAEMVMTSATTFPLIDEEVLMADGQTKGFYPVTLSPLFVTGMLREDLGFDGVVITDALEMQQFIKEPDSGADLFTGDPYTVEHDLQVAEKAINAGCDILLIPLDLNCDEAAAYYEDYIDGLVKLTEDGVIGQDRIDASVKRILSLKERHGILDLAADGSDVEQRVEAALETVGSPAHHAAELEIAKEAITLLKNEDVLPLSLSAEKTDIVIVGRTARDNTPISFALDQLMSSGTIDKDARVENLITGETAGSGDAATNIVIGCYYDSQNGGELVYSDELSAAIEEADAVICLSSVEAGLEQLQDDSLPVQGIGRALSESKEAGADFILLSTNLPVDAARFQEADAIVCAYLSSGYRIDPTAPAPGVKNIGAFNANVPAAICAIFGEYDMPGRLPINIPVLEKGEDGSYSYGEELLYERGFNESRGQ